MTVQDLENFLPPGEVVSGKRLCVSFVRNDTDYVHLHSKDASFDSIEDENDAVDCSY